jgi:hypothetical protein
MGIPDAEGQGFAEGLPDLPPEWGRIVVPDDPSDLAEEALLVRRELGGRARRERWRRRLGGTDPRLLGLPALIVLVLAVTAAATLLVAAWPRSSRGGGDRPTVVPRPTSTGPVGRTGHPLPALDLVDAGQAPVPLRGLLPAVIILVDACSCTEQVAAAVAAAPEGLHVLVVGAGVRMPALPPPAGPPMVRAVADPTGGLRTFLGVPARAGSTTVVLVHRSGTVQRVLPEARSVEDYRAELGTLVG